MQYLLKGAWNTCQIKPSVDLFSTPPPKSEAMTINLHFYRQKLSQLSAFFTLACVTLFTAPQAAAQSAPELSLARLDCGTPVPMLVARFNDTWA